MSHFTVAVFTKPGGKTVDELLAPFQENNMGDCPQEYLEFYDMEVEYRERYTGTTTMVKTPEGKLIFTWDDELKKFSSNLENLSKEECKAAFDKRLLEAGYQKGEFFFFEKYLTFEEFMEDYGGYSKEETTGKYGYWANPNAKWDWWTEGGRWSGLIKLKAPVYLTAPDTVGKFGFSINEFMQFVTLYNKDREKLDKILDKYNGLRDEILLEIVTYVGMINGASNKKSNTDSAQIKNIDWEGMEEESRKSAAESWERAMKEDAGLRHFLYDITPGMTKEEYMAKNEAFSTYAVLTPDGKWWEKGQMGWWGISSNEDETWGGSYKEKFIDMADPEWTLTVVDCHI